MKKTKIFSLILAVCYIALVFTACGQAEHKAITAAYAKESGVSESEINFTCYAEFHGAHVLILGGVYAAVISTEIIDGIKFEHPSAATFDVYYKGKFYSLQEAFDKGIINHRNLLTLQRKYKQ